MLEPDPAARPESMAHVATWPLPTSRPNDDRYASDLSRSAERRHPSKRHAGNEMDGARRHTRGDRDRRCGSRVLRPAGAEHAGHEGTAASTPARSRGKASPPSDSSTVAAALAVATRGPNAHTGHSAAPAMTPRSRRQRAACTRRSGPACRSTPTAADASHLPLNRSSAQTAPSAPAEQRGTERDGGAASPSSAAPNRSRATSTATTAATASSSRRTA